MSSSQDFNYSAMDAVAHTHDGLIWETCSVCNGACSSGRHQCDYCRNVGAVQVPCRCGQHQQTVYRPQATAGHEPRPRRKGPGGGHSKSDPKKPISTRRK